MRRTLITKAGFGASCVAALVLLSACGSSNNGQSAAPANWATTTLQGRSAITIAHPTSWRFVPSTNEMPGLTLWLGYLTNEPTHDQCATAGANGATQTSCGPPVSQLRPGGVLIEAYGTFGSAARRPSNAIVDGHKVEITSLASSPFCPHGTTGATQMTGDVPDSSQQGARWNFRIVACFDATGTSDPLATDVSRMIRTVKFT